MKKVCAAILSLVLTLCLTSAAFAAESVKPNLDMKLIEAAKIAYLDLEDASPKMREEILAAREEIIFSTDWVADGYTACVEDLDGNVIRILPTFSEVFPDWDLPVSDPTWESDVQMDSNCPQVMDTPAASSDGWTWEGYYTHYLTAPGNVISEPFAEVYVDPQRVGHTIRAYAISFSSYRTRNCNIGFTDSMTGESLAYATRLKVGEACKVTGVRMKFVGIRASTYSTPGQADFQVDGWGATFTV